MSPSLRPLLPPRGQCRAMRLTGSRLGGGLRWTVVGRGELKGPRGVEGRLGLAERLRCSQLEILPGPRFWKFKRERRAQGRGGRKEGNLLGSCKDRLRPGKGARHGGQQWQVPSLDGVYLQ